MLGTAAITGTLGTFRFTSAGNGSVIMTGASKELSDLEQRIRLRIPSFTLGLPADALHGYNGHCILSESVAALVFSEVFRSLTRPYEHATNLPPDNRHPVLRSR